MAFGFDSDAEGPDWLPWLQIGVSTLLAVLFVVMLIKSRDQNQRLQQLEMRLQGVENNRSLDRTAALEQQLRTLAKRMQGLEGQREELESTRRERDEMRSELQQIRQATPPPGQAAAAGLPPAASPGPPRPSYLLPQARPFNPSQRSGSGVLLPSPADSR
ncbi:hypothetical protein NZK33_13690 [Cyanobium sp. FGCU-6]|jgi:hypothetical protein|nr:hypothetical protein [Cyanobium sp. FGCU6]